MLLIARRAYKSANRIRRDYKRAMMNLSKGDYIIFFQNDKLTKGEIIEVMPDVVQVITLDHILIYIPKTKIITTCLN